MRRRSWQAALTGLVLLLAGCGSNAATSSGSASAGNSKPLTKLNMAFSSVSYAQIALPVAQEQGIFAKHGIDANFIFGPNGIPAQLAGEVQVSTTSTEEIILADLGGANLVTIGTMVPYLQHKFVGRPEIKSVEDLRGKTVGVTRRGTLTETVPRMAAKRAGLDPDKDWTWLELGTTDKQVIGLTSGSIFAASFSPPNDTVAIQQGAHVLIDFQAEHIEYPVAQIIVTKDWLQKNQLIALELLRSLAEAAALTRTQPDAVKAIYAKWAQTGEDAANIAVTTAKEQVQVKMLPTAQGIRQVQDAMAVTNPAAGSADTNRFFDDSLIKKLESDRFYDPLPK